MNQEKLSLAMQNCMKLQKKNQRRNKNYGGKVKNVFGRGRES